MKVSSPVAPVIIRDEHGNIIKEIPLLEFLQEVTKGDPRLQE